MPVLLTVSMLFIAVLFVLTVIHFRQLDEFKDERALWQEERRELLDRIQAPSFNHLKEAEVRMMKAAKDEKPIPEYELL